MTQLLFAEPAARDLEAIIDYIAQDSPAAAEGVYRRIMQVVRMLPEFPLLGRPGRHPATRELSISDLPYLIVYEADAGTVTVLAVFHTSRDLLRAWAERVDRGKGSGD